MKKNLILTGMMGVGKSTLGKALSTKLKMNFFDTDAEIEKSESETIEAIFKKKGENYFRIIEKKICSKLIKKPNSIIALGGGSFMHEELRNIMLETCVTFWLELDLNNLKDRLKISKKRPLLNKKNIEKKIESIYLQRKEVYNLAHYKITCTNKDREEILKEILKIYENN